jgi:hypothetical protein
LPCGQRYSLACSSHLKSLLENVPRDNQGESGATIRMRELLGARGVRA